MSNNQFSIWIWMQILTPHMSALAESLAKRGCKVTFVSNMILSPNRSKQGWEKPSLSKTSFKLVTNKKATHRLAMSAPNNSIHLCQGLRGNGLVKSAQNIIKKRGLSHWVLMEAIDDAGLIGIFKKFVYHFLFFQWRNHLSGVLAIGQNSSEWFIKRGMVKDRIYPFAYFLENPKKYISKKSFEDQISNRPFRFIFVGRLIKLKKLDLLINAIEALNIKDIELWIVGNGPEKYKLKQLAQKSLPTKVKWLGTMPITKIPEVLSDADCLVLPSRYDGWGAVISEALMVGTPVICSDNCGAANVVTASNVGSVFSTNDFDSLVRSLKSQLKKGKCGGKVRKKISDWSKCLDSESGAEYLKLIMQKRNNIIPPWLKK